MTYIVWREDDCDEVMGKFKTLAQAKRNIKELKAFDARHHNPFNEKYYITKENNYEQSKKKSITKTL